MTISRGSFALSLIFLFVFAIVAQDLDDVTFSGKIVDANGLAIAGATVTATQIETGLERTVTTDENGRFQIVKLKPGPYKVKATHAGFGTLEKTDIQTISGQVVQFDFKLSPAAVTAEQTVNVNDDDAPGVDTTRTVVGDTITKREIEEIPNDSRNTLDLVLTLGGTTEESLSTNGLAEDRNASVAPLEQGNFSLSGGTAYSNNITIDGLDNNDDRSSRDRFQPSIEGIAEVQVIKNQFSAEYGRASGGRVNLRTASGGNKLRGRAFMFFRDDNLNANTFYDNTRKYTPIPPLQLPDTNPRYNRTPLTDYNPGFTLSGPVVLPSIYNGHNRTFFAVAYEYDDLLDTTKIDAFVPLVANPHYTLPTSTGGNQTCDGSPTVPNPPTQPTTPCAPATGSPTAAYVVPYTKDFPTPSRSHVFTARIDHKLFKTNDLTFGFQYGSKTNLRQAGVAVSKIEDAFQARNSDTQAYNLTDNQILGTHAVNQFRTQWSVFKPSFETANALDPVVIISYRDPNTNTVKSLVAGNSTASTFSTSGITIFFPENRKETRFQAQDSLTYMLHSHTLKGGVDIQRVNSQELGLGDATGTFNFGSVLDYGNNKLNRYRQNFGTGQDVINTYYGVFANDEFRARQNVTVSYGVRYEKETAISDNNNWGPRVGIAWDPFNKGKGVVRFGAGIFYNRVLLRTVGDSIQNTGGNLVTFDTSTIGTAATDVRRVPILAALSNQFPGTFASTAELKALVTAACATIVTTLPCNSSTGFVTNVSSAGNPLRSVEPNLQIPESYQFNIGFEREIAKGLVLEANYTWNKTVRLWRDANPNAPSLLLANHQLGTSYADWTAYLLDHPFQLSPSRKYTFFMGPTNDATGTHAATQTGATCVTTTPNCFVNLNTTNGSSTAPAVAVPGQNNNATGAPIGIALAAIAPFRPDQTVEETSRIGSSGKAFYQGLIVGLRSRYRKLGNGFGASWRFAYTLSSTKDDGLNNTANAEIDGDFEREWARNLQDRRHRLAFTATLDTPSWFGRLKFSPLIRWGSSSPFNIGDGGDDRNLDDLGTDRLNFSGDIKDIVWRKSGSLFPQALASRFTLQPIGAVSGNLPRNAGTGPMFYTFDMSVSREWKLGEKIRLRPVIEVTNVFNASVFSYGAEFIDVTGLVVSDPTAQQEFLVPTRTYSQRKMRIGLRFDF